MHAISNLLNDIMPDNKKLHQMEINKKKKTDKDKISKLNVDSRFNI